MTQFYKTVSCSIALALADFISLILSVYLALGILSLTLSDFHHRVPDAQIESWVSLHWILAGCCILWYAMRLRHYFYRKTFWLELKEVLRTIIIFAVIEMAIMAFSKWYFSRYVWLYTWALSFILVPLIRFLTKKILNYFGLWLRDTLIIGCGKNAEDAYNAIHSENNLGLVVRNFISPGKDNGSINGIPVSNIDIKNLASLDKRTQFIIALEANESEIRNDWLREFMLNGFRYVSVIPTLRGMPLDNTDMSFIFSHEVMMFRVHNSLAKLSSRVLKRAFDVISATLIIILISPLLLYIGIKVRKDGGPIIYGHLRVGKNGKLFKCLKFRSMVVNSKEVLDALIKSDKDAKAEWEATFKLKNDPRITNIGNFLRKTSLDELPQLFNVLKGDMSLVGPRPIITAELDRYSDQVGYYLLSKPGMTGLWQVSGRSDVDYDTRVYFDTWYVKNWSMWNDVAILFKTISVVLKKDGAY